MNLMKALRGSDVSRKILNVSESNGNIGTPGVLYNNLLRFCGCLHNMKKRNCNCSQNHNQKKYSPS